MTSHPDVQDLNALLPARRKVQFGESTYEVPGDMPMEVYLRTQIAISEETDEAEGTRQLRQAFVDLLTFYLPGDEAAKARIENDLRPVGVRTILLLLGGIYRDEEAEEDGAAEGNDSSPTTAAATPTTTGTLSSESSQTPSLEIPAPATV